MAIETIAGETNRITDAVGRIRLLLADLSDDKIDNLHDINVLTFEDHFGYQTQQSYAHAGGKLTTAEAQTIYVALGESMNADNGGWAQNVDLATKIVVTQVMGELLGVAS